MRRLVWAGIGVAAGVVSAFVAVALDAPKARQMDPEWGRDDGEASEGHEAILRAELVRSARERWADRITPT